MDATTLKDWESRCNPAVDTGNNDPRLIEPKLQALRSKEVAIKQGDTLGVLYANARLDELKALDWEDLG